MEVFLRTPTLVHGPRQQKHLTSDYLLWGILAERCTAIAAGRTNERISGLSQGRGIPLNCFKRIKSYLYFKTITLGFPGGAVVENLPAQCRGHGFEPWSGKIPHAAEQLSP